MKALRQAWTASAVLSALLLAAAIILPRLPEPEHPGRGLSRLRSKAEAIRKEFQLLLRESERRQQALSSVSRARPAKGVFQVFSELGLSEEREGAAFHSRDGKLEAWWGHILDLEPLLVSGGQLRTLLESTQSFIIKDKASVYLVSCREMGRGYALLFRLLSFRSQFRSPYLADYHFLSPSADRNIDVDYWDFQEDLAGFERIFSRHKDEYLGHPRETGVVSSLIFPLRLRDGRIAATVTLSLPSPASSRALLREKLLAFLSRLVTLVLLVRSSSGIFSRPIVRVASFTTVLAVMRIILLLLSRQGAFQSLLVFSPVPFAVRSLGGLTRSPADLFLTSSLLFLAAAYAALSLRKSRPAQRSPLPLPLSGLASLAASLLALGALHLLQAVLGAIVDNSNINLLRFSFSSSFLLIHFSLLALALTVFMIPFQLFRPSAHRPVNNWVRAAGLALGAVVFWVVIRPSNLLLGLILPLLTAALILAAAATLRRVEAGRVLFLAAALTAFFLAVSLNLHAVHRNRGLVQDTLKNLVLSQEEWASFFLDEALETIDGNESLVLEALTTGRDGQEARRIWEKTVIARFNWYSSLEILDERNETVSRFALNVPRSFKPSPGLPQSGDWTISALSVAFIGREKEFLVGHRDWYEEGRCLGRTVLAVSLDYDLLPFLYSANPYFELLRVHSLPSLEPIDLGFIVFDEEGKILFNPGHLISGPPPASMPVLLASPEGRWVRWKERGKMLSVFCFPCGGRLCGLNLAGKTPVGLASEFLKLFFLYGLFLAVPLFVFVLLFRRTVLRSFLKSFSNRVYASFLIIALIPLLLLTVFTRSYFAGVIARQFTRAAESDAVFARNVLQDFLYLQREEKSVVLPPPEDLVLWVSAAVGNDVNLYQDGRLVSSSRREFFDAGVLPVLLDGELHHRFQSELPPFLTQRRKIGKFSFYTLTIPFEMGDSDLHLSLPFPFERQEVAGATAGLVDFLILASIFFALAVAGVARSLGSAIVTPIRKLLAGTREVSLGNLEVSLEHKPDDEMQTLIQGFNTMVLSLKQHQRELAEMSQKAAWAEIARKVAHEVKNPLTPIQLSAEHLLRVYEDGRSDFKLALQQSVSFITSEVENLRKIAQEFLEISRDIALVKEPADLREILEETLAPYRHILTDRISVREFYASGPLRVLADRSKLKTAIRNFLINSLESISGRGTITVRTSRKDVGAVVNIEDTGSGMSPELLNRIFETYFSTKPSGTGLGLPISKKIIEDHGGELCVASRPGKGTTVTIVLPLVPE